MFLERSLYISHFHIDRLDLCVIIQCVWAIFSPQSRFLVPPKGDPHGVNIVIVDVEGASLQSRSYSVCPLEVTETHKSCMGKKWKHIHKQTTFIQWNNNPRNCLFQQHRKSSVQFGYLFKAFIVYMYMQCIEDYILMPTLLKLAPAGH